MILLSCLSAVGHTARSLGQALPAEIQGLQSSYHCAPLEAGQHPDHRVCFFKNLLLFNGSLVYLGPDARSIPAINTEYWLGGTLQESMTNYTSIELLQPRPERVVTVNKAALTDWIFYHNYFHVFAEYLPSLHNVLCKYWDDCTFNSNSDLDIILLTPLIDVNRSRDAVHTDAAACVTSKPISAVSATINNTHTAVLIKDAIAGWGPECRADHWHCLPWWVLYPLPYCHSLTTVTVKCPLLPSSGNQHLHSQHHPLLPAAQCSAPYACKCATSIVCCCWIRSLSTTCITYHADLCTSTSSCLSRRICS